MALSGVDSKQTLTTPSTTAQASPGVQTQTSSGNAGWAPQTQNAALSTHARTQSGMSAFTQIDGGGSSTVAPPSTQNPQKASSLSSADRQSAQDAIAKADGPPRDAAPVAEWLAQHPDSATQSQFYDLMMNYGPVAGEVLNATRNLDQGQKDMLSSTLYFAYKDGTVTNSEVQKMVVAGGYGASFGESHNGLGEIVGATGIPELIKTYADQELALVKNGEPQREQAAANALAGMPPDELQSYLAQNPTLIHDMVNNKADKAGAQAAATVLADLPPDQLQKYMSDPSTKGDFAQMLQHINDGDSYENGQGLALGKLLKAAGNVYPTSPEVVDLFSKSIDLVGNNPASLQGLATLFSSDSADLVKSLTKDGNSGGGTTLSKFFAKTLFSPDVQGLAFDGGGTMTDAIQGAMKTAANSLGQQFSSSSPDVAARQLGRLTASMEGAAAITLKDYKDAITQNGKTRDAFAGLISKGLGAALPDFLAKDFVLDQVTKRVSSALFPDPSKPNTVAMGHAVSDEYEGQLSAYDSQQNPKTTRTTDYDAAYGKEDVSIREDLGINFDGSGGN